MSLKKPLNVVQIYDGAWYALGGFDRDMCCDCGLVHVTEYKIEKGRIMFRAVRDDKATAEQRRKHGIEIKRQDAG